MNTMTFNTLSKKFLFTGIGAVLSLVTVACDNISSDDRYIELEPVEQARVVLLEDFTGQNCVNCPDAHAIIEGLQEQYGDGIIAVSIHGGAFAINRKMTSFDRDFIGLGTPEGEYYNTKYGINSWPKGLIDRAGGLQNYADWSATVRTELQRPADVAINLDASFRTNEAAGAIDIDVELIPQDDIDGSLNVWILESGIVARQRNTKGLIKDYVHNNVLRAAVNGNEGEEVSLKKGLHNSFTYSIDVRNSSEEVWVPENLTVVAFVSASDGVHQAAKKDITID